MNKFEYDPIAPVNTPKVLTPGAVTDPTIPQLQPVAPVAIPAGTKEIAPELLAAIITGAVSIGGTVYNNWQQRKLQKRQEEFQKEYFDYTFNKQTAEKWKEINYNDPFQQMQRLRSAGLNENLMYGTLGNVAGAAGNAPANAPSGLSGSAPTAAPYFDSGSIIQALLSPLQAMSQISLNNSQSFKNYKSAGVDDQQANRLAMLTPLEVEQYRAKNHLLDQEFLKMQNETVKLAKDITERNIYLSLCRRIYQAQLDKLNAESFGIYVKGDYDAAAAVRMARETDIVLPALANSYNATAAEKWQEVKRLSATLESYKKEMAARANVSESEAESYFWREVVPAYVDSGIDIAELVVSRGLKMKGLEQQAAGMHGKRTTSTHHYNGKGEYRGSTYTDVNY